MAEIDGQLVVALLVLVGLVLLLSNDVPSRLQFNNPTMTWPIFYVGLAGGAAVGTIWLLVRADVPGRLAVLVGGAAAFFILRLGSTVTGTRVNYDRGGRVMAPGDFLFSVGAAAAFFLMLIQ